MSPKVFISFFPNYSNIFLTFLQNSINISGKRLRKVKYKHLKICFQNFCKVANMSFLKPVSRSHFKIFNNLKNVIRKCSKNFYEITPKYTQTFYHNFCKISRYFFSKFIEKNRPNLFDFSKIFYKLFFKNFRNLFEIFQNISKFLKVTPILQSIIIILLKMFSKSLVDAFFKNLSKFP